MSEIGDIAAGRLDSAQLAANFADAHPPLSPAQAVVEASRCYFCHDAPCVEACPTGIDVPSFIRKIATGNLLGSAQTILESNILGGSCARQINPVRLDVRAESVPHRRHVGYLWNFIVGIGLSSKISHSSVCTGFFEELKFQQVRVMKLDHLDEAEPR